MKRRRRERMERPSEPLKIPRPPGAIGFSLEMDGQGRLMKIRYMYETVEPPRLSGGGSGRLDRGEAGQ